MPSRGPARLSGAHIRRAARPAVRTGGAGRDPGRRPDRAQRGARTPLRAPSAARRRARFPLPLRARPSRVEREHLAGPTPTDRPADPATYRCRMTATDFGDERVFARAGEAAFVMDPEHGRIVAANDAGC